MAKLNSIGVRAKDIDRIFSNAIKQIAEGEQEFSCVAISSLLLNNHNRNRLKVRRLYEDTLTSGPCNELSFSLLCLVINHVGCVNNNKSQGFRILMLSLVKAAWRDLV